MIDPGDDTHRRTVNTQTTVQESRHRLARKVFHGKHGQVYQKYREGQEDQLGALGLVINAITLWNTRYLDAARTHLVLRVVSDFMVRVRDNGVCLLLRRLCCVLVMSRD